MEYGENALDRPVAWAGDAGMGQAGGTPAFNLHLQPIRLHLDLIQGLQLVLLVHPAVMEQLLVLLGQQHLHGIGGGLEIRQTAFCGLSNGMKNGLGSNISSNISKKNGQQYGQQHGQEYEQQHGQQYGTRYGQRWHAGQAEKKKSSSKNGRAHQTSPPGLSRRAIPLTRKNGPMNRNGGQALRSGAYAIRGSCYYYCDCQCVAGIECRTMSVVNRRRS